VGTQRKVINKFLKNTYLSIYSMSENTVGKILNRNKNINLNEFNICEVHLLTCQIVIDAILDRLAAPSYTIPRTFLGF